MIGAECIVIKHRTDLLKEINYYLHGINKDKEIFIAVDFNQEIGRNKMQTFCREIGVQDELHCCDKISRNDRDVAFKRGSKHVDSIAMR